MKVSILILTFNEEANLKNCLDSIRWCDDIVVLDSLSSDATQSIAREEGARLEERPFDNYAAQRNYGINDISYKNPWLLMLDADEVVPPGLAGEIESLTAADDMCIYRVRHKNCLMGRWLKRSTVYPTWAGRLIRIGSVSVKREINEEYHTNGEVGLLQEHILHYSFNKGFHSWFEKHNNYSTAEAQLLYRSMHGEVNVSALFDKDPAIRRAMSKKLFYKLPFRPLIMFFTLYLLRGGFTEGKAGLMYSLLRSYYEFMINCKIKELKRRERGISI